MHYWYKTVIESVNGVSQTTTNQSGLTNYSIFVDTCRTLSTGVLQIGICVDKTHRRDVWSVLTGAPFTWLAESPSRVPMSTTEIEWTSSLLRNSIRYFFNIAVNCNIWCAQVRSSFSWSCIFGFSGYRCFCGSMASWLAHLEFELVDPGSIPRSCHTIPLGSNLVQIVYTHCLPSFSTPRNWGIKGSFRRLSGYGE